MPRSLLLLCVGSSTELQFLLHQKAFQKLVLYHGVWVINIQAYPGYASCIVGGICKSLNFSERSFQERREEWSHPGPPGLKSANGCVFSIGTQFLRWELKGGKVRFDSLLQRFPSMFSSLEARFLGLEGDRMLWWGACGRVCWSSHESWEERWKGRGEGLNIPFKAVPHVIYFLQLSLKPPVTSQESVQPWPHELTNTFLRPQQSWFRHLSDNVMPGTKSLTQRSGVIFTIKIIIVVFLGVLPTEEAASMKNPGRHKSQSNGPHLKTLADSLVKCWWSR